MERLTEEQIARLDALADSGEMRPGLVHAWLSVKELVRNTQPYYPSTGEITEYGKAMQEALAPYGMAKVNGIASQAESIMARIGSAILGPNVRAKRATAACRQAREADDKQHGLAGLAARRWRSA